MDTSVESPEDPRVAVEAQHPPIGDDDQQVAVAERLDQLPGIVGLEHRVPAVQYLAVHVHEEGPMRLSGRVEIEPRVGTVRIVDRHAPLVETAVRRHPGEVGE